MEALKKMMRLLTSTQQMIYGTISWFQANYIGCLEYVSQHLIEFVDVPIDIIVGYILRDNVK